MESKRIVSIDVLRGLTMFMLLFFQPVLYSYGKIADCQWILYNFDHEVWEGFRLWDMIMPLFMFLSGASLPFSMAKYEGRKKAAYLKVGRRFIILFLLGMVAQGRLLAFDPEDIHTYVNTLQAIGAGYVIAAVTILNIKSWEWRWAVVAALLLIYSTFMALFGDYTLEGSFAYRVDEVIMGRFRGDLTYTWIWSSLNFGVTVLLGSMAGTLLKDGARPWMTRITGRRGDASGRQDATLSIIIIGVLCIAAAFLIREPIIKRLWTSSMALLAGGISLILIGVFHWWIDCSGHIRGLGWLRIYGMNSIVAYMIGECIRFSSVSKSLLFGFEQFIPEYYGVLVCFFDCLILFVILKQMYKHRIFIKI